MLAYRYPLIAREGWHWIAAFAIPAAILTYLYGVVALPAWLPVLLLLFLFRDPHRTVPASPLGIVSPVDGHVVKVENVYDGYLQREAICLSLEMSLTSIYSVRSPLEGKLVKMWMAVPRKIGDNAHQVLTSGKTYAQWIQSDEQDDVVMVVDATGHARRPRCYAQSGERIGQGQRCGYIRFGTHFDVLLPATTRIQVNAGDRVVAGESIVATLVHKA
jgi:phosphatidylserine decarboxylase